MELGIGKMNMAFQRALTLSKLVTARLALVPAASARWTLPLLGHGGQHSTGNTKATPGACLFFSPVLFLSVPQLPALETLCT